MKFGENLKQIRKSRNISQEELAERLGVSRQSVSKWETGENYPSMFNIMCLCDIFKCKINNLVHESMTDINSLDNEVKMSVVKFKEEKQKKVKVLSKIISIIAKIGNVCCLIGIIAASAALVVAPIIVSSIKVKDNEIIFRDKMVRILEKEDEMVVKVKDKTIATIDREKSIEVIREIADKDLNNKALIITYTELGIGCLVISLFLSRQLFKRLDKLFTNIHSGDTPFTLENVEHIKKIAYIMIALIIIPGLSAAMFELIIHQDLDVTFGSFSVLEILIMSYIFEYGYEIQLDSKGKMYDEEQ